MVTTPRTALFRADASATLGIGHVMRCLTLAAELNRRGWRCRFACDAETLRTVPALRSAPVELIELAAARDPAALAALAPPQWLVVDHYGLDQAYERALAAWAEHILVLDDLADRPHHCDILLDQTIGASADRYLGLVPHWAVVLAGAGHALLRPDFAEAGPSRVVPLDRILVSLGGTDPTNATGLALQALAAVGLGLPVSVVMGGAAPHLEAVRDLASRLTPQAEVLVDVADMAALMARCGLAVGAAGTSALERCRMGLPSVAVVIADNQRDIAKGLEREGAALVSALDIAALARSLSLLAGDERARSRMAGRARSLCDGRGAARLADLMSLDLRRAGPEDGEVLLAWRNDPVTRANSLETAEVERDHHFAWLDRVLADRERILMIGEYGGERIGMVRFDTCRDKEWRVSVSVAPEARGKGAGQALLTMAVSTLLRQVGPVDLIAEIREANPASRKIFVACGFVQADRADEILYFRRNSR
ncbi:UDP-2,4-diacetamido-2,4,6-trideoxy-beta-L-altropyranose hydrolase [Paramagnetospirillum kuznetsovii]|uniref:UDP-2,4-diacetamido-2,4, 6-trideoxy-beta-L-altropyranose hydrolase n=1 Tax=Paramagnetospirillum kuznetsovii TaxID=2053833 RepID=A0A364P0Q5_9PROT|nr:UDP-2,4-diacetamido-2,4,6-trideoxy-beta-L-altropyranose hydrolase [Paramagnetospirillum kuznetsovii]RAU22886.1 UDP-2,4-diacetamido-2,4,6-trideoxy-beta-L-altropyranose hydrolase [Paramagnetospirillum kuznetsovii]